MSALAALPGPPRDLPVCFTGHPCVEYSPFVADAINLTSSLTPFSPAIAIGGLALLGAALVMIAFELRPRARALRLRVVALPAALVVAGAVVSGSADLRLDAIATIFGLEGPGSPDLYGAWGLVGFVGRAMSVAGFAALLAAASVAVLWLPRFTGPPPTGRLTPRR